MVVHERNLIQDYGIMHRFVRVLAPGERSMALYEHRRNAHRVNSAERFNYDLAGLLFVLAADLLRSNLAVDDRIIKRGNVYLAVLYAFFVAVERRDEIVEHIRFVVDNIKGSSAGALVEVDYRGFTGYLVIAGEYAHVVVHFDEHQMPLFERVCTLADHAELPCELDEVEVFTSPGVAAAVERIAVALHARLVAVVNRRDSRQEELKQENEDLQAKIDQADQNLQDAKDALTKAQENERKAQSTYDTAVSDYNTLKSAYDSASASISTYTAALNAAADAQNQAISAVNSAIAAYNADPSDANKDAMNAANDNLKSAQEAYQSAQASLTDAQNSCSAPSLGLYGFNNISDALKNADSTKNQAESALDSAKNAVDTANTQISTCEQQVTTATTRRRTTPTC